MARNAFEAEELARAQDRAVNEGPCGGITLRYLVKLRIMSSRAGLVKKIQVIPAADQLHARDVHPDPTVAYRYHKAILGICICSKDALGTTHHKRRSEVKSTANQSNRIHLVFQTVSISVLAKRPSNCCLRQFCKDVGQNAWRSSSPNARPTVSAV